MELLCFIRSKSNPISRRGAPVKLKPNNVINETQNLAGYRKINKVYEIMGISKLEENESIRGFFGFLDFGAVGPFSFGFRSPGLSAGATFFPREPDALVDISRSSFYIISDTPKLGSPQKEPLR